MSSKSICYLTKTPAKAFWSCEINNSNNTFSPPADLLEKVGELVAKLFDLDEELMKSWITSQPHEDEEEEDGQSQLDVILCLLEAAKQLRWELNERNCSDAFFRMQEMLCLLRGSDKHMHTLWSSLPVVAE